MLSITPHGSVGRNRTTTHNIACQRHATIFGRVSPRRGLTEREHHTPHCVPCVGLLRVSPSGAFWMAEQSRLKNKNTPINHSFSKIYTFSNAIKSVLNQKQLKLLHPFTHTLSYSRYWYRRPLFSSVKISEAETSRNTSVSMGGKKVSASKVAKTLVRYIRATNGKNWR